MPSDNPTDVIQAELVRRHIADIRQQAANRRQMAPAMMNSDGERAQTQEADRLDALADALQAAQHRQEMGDETGWLIEYGPSEPSRPRYWGGVHSWTYDNLKAVRFAREIDAQSIAESMDDGVQGNYRLAEHMWPAP